MLLEHGLGEGGGLLEPIEDLEGTGFDERAPLPETELVERLEVPTSLRSSRLALGLRDEAPKLVRIQAGVSPREVDDPALVATLQPEERVDRVPEEPAGPNHPRHLGERRL